MVRHGGHRAAARDELRHRHGRDGRRLRRVLQPRARHAVERAQTLARLRSAAQRPLLVPRQRDGRALADRPVAGARVRAEGARRRQADARDRSGFAADRVRIQRHVHADLSRLGSRGPGGVLRPGGRHLAACLLRQHEGVVGQQHGPLPGDESRHGTPDSRGGRGVRLRAGAAAVEQAPVAVVRRVERLVRARDTQSTDGRARRRTTLARGGLQPRGCAPRRRVHQHPAPQFGSRATWPASRSWST